MKGDECDLEVLWQQHVVALTQIDALRSAGSALLESLGEYVRQSMHLNPEWRPGLDAMQAALADATATTGASTCGDIRAQGWEVGVHNDYRLDGRPHTFWLFTKDGRCVKGEGRTDAIALDEVREQIKYLATPRNQRHQDCATHASSTCVFLRDGTKIVIKRDGARSWLEHTPQAVMHLANGDGAPAAAPTDSPKE